MLRGIIFCEWYNVLCGCLEHECRGMHNHQLGSNCQAQYRAVEPGRMQADTGLRSFCEFESSLVWYEEQGAVPGARKVGRTSEQWAPGSTCQEYWVLYCRFCALSYKVFVHEFCGQTTTIGNVDSDWQTCREQGILSRSQYMQHFPTVLIYMIASWNVCCSSTRIFRQDWRILHQSNCD